MDKEIISEESVFHLQSDGYLVPMFKVLLEDGYSPVVAWFVCFYEVKNIVDLFSDKGLDYMFKAVSETAEYGGQTRADRLIDDDIAKEMKEILHNCIQ